MQHGRDDPILFPFDRHTRRRIRLLKALQGRHLHQAYLLDSQVRRDLAVEADYGATHFDDSLITPELLVDLCEQLAKSLQAPKGRLLSGAPPPAEVMNAASYSSSNGTVVIVVGGLMSQLADFKCDPERLIWINGSELIKGRFRDLQLATYAGPDQEQDLKSPRVKILPDGPIPILYDSLTAALCSDGWIPCVFDYDWRKDIDHPEVSGRLQTLIKRLGAKGKPVHVVAHSQGSIVARVALRKLAVEIGCKAAEKLIGKVIMLGPANHGAFVVALAIADSVNEIPVCQMITRPHRWAQKVLASFTAFYQLMPWDENLVCSLQKPEFDVRRDDFWAKLKYGKIQYDRLHVAIPPGGTPWGAGIDTKCFKGRVTVIVGSHPFRKTPGGVCFSSNGRLKVNKHYDFDDGDGWVPDVLARIPGIPTYRATSTGHIRLPMAGSVIDGIQSILNNQTPAQLTKLP